MYNNTTTVTDDSDLMDQYSDYISAGVMLVSLGCLLYIAIRV